MTTMPFGFQRVQRFLLLAAFVLLASAEFTPHFRDFLVQHYGRDTKIALERLDMGLLSMGSFGGKLDAHENVTNRVRASAITLRHVAFSLSCLFME